ncbi:MAG TPA: hypothetical protein VKD69_13830 [Vicinamibacterales bacterium]|nr:hypothetical protein [Vicinamibacterales bacterium]
MSSPDARVGIVVKVGGALLANVEVLDAVLTAIAAAARARRLLVVPGGGPFADAVRAVDGRIGLPATAAHWMAVLAMDQYAHLIAARLDGATVVSYEREVPDAYRDGRVPVLAPSRWLREVDPLPHSWDVTSDSIAAWIAGRFGAPRLVLVKPPAAPADPVDSYFARALRPSVDAVIVAADEIDALRRALR